MGKDLQLFWRGLKAVEEKHNATLRNAYTDEPASENDNVVRVFINNTLVAKVEIGVNTYGWHSARFSGWKVRSRDYPARGHYGDLHYRYPNNQRYWGMRRYQSVETFCMAMDKLVENMPSKKEELANKQLGKLSDLRNKHDRNMSDLRHHGGFSSLSTAGEALRILSIATVSDELAEDIERLKELADKADASYKLMQAASEKYDQLERDAEAENS